MSKSWQYQFLIMAMDYLIKWMEAKPLANINIMNI